MIEDKQPKGTLLISSANQADERFSALQLQSYLEKMTGVALPIQASDQAPEGPVLVIGRHPLSESVVAELDRRYPKNTEGLAIVSRGDHLHLVGQSNTATAWASWGWLESLGVRWLIPTPWGEHVPSTERVAFGVLERYEAPGMKFRGPSYSMPERDGFPPFASALDAGMDVGVLYALRRRSNWNVGVSPGEGVRGVGGGHSYMYYLPADRYFADHPEWFNLIDGKRQGPGTYWWQVCFTNEEGAAQFSENFLAEIERWMALGFSQDRFKAFVSPNDFRAWCECAPCQALVDADGSASSMVFHYANLVARHVHAKYPDIPIVVYAYVNHASPASRIQLAPNVIPELTMWTAANSTRANHAHPMFSAPNQRYQDYFNRWSSMADGIMAYAYYGHYNWFIPWPQLHSIAHDLPVMASNEKFLGLYSESHMHWATQAPNFYLQNALMWDPQADPHAVMTDYFRAAHGPAASAIQRYFETLDRQMASLGYICGLTEEIPQLLTPQVMQRCRALIDQARTHLDAMDPNMRWRTELVIEGWEISEKFGRAVTLSLNPRSKADRRQILRLIGEVREYMATEKGSFAFEKRMADPQVGGIENPLKLGLDELPAGTHTWSAGAAHGGAFNFWAEVSGMSSGIWGYYMPAGGRSTFTLPLRAESGKKITGARIRFNGPPAEQVSLNVSLARSTRAGDTTTLPAQTNTFFEAPAEVLGQRNLVVTAEFLNHHHDPLTVLYGMTLELTVE